jgi:ribosomal RNA assembly protein
MRKGVKVSKKRISLIEKSKDELEEMTEVNISITGLQVELEGESLKVWKASNIIDAIEKGFSFKRSLKLLNDKNQLKIVRLKDITSSREEINKIKGRVIGKDGRTRELIEEYSKALVSVHGDYVSVIGRPEEIGVASKAIQMLINGTPHGRVYSYLEQNQPTEKLTR